MSEYNCWTDASLIRIRKTKKSGGKTGQMKCHWQNKLRVSDDGVMQTAQF